MISGAKLLRAALYSSFFLFFLLGCNSQTDSTPVKIYELSGKVFGSTYSIKYIGDLNPALWQKELDGFFQDFNSEFSTYQNDSVISRFNSARAGEKIKVSRRFIEMLKLSSQFHEQTNGAFDPTLEPVLMVWGFSGKQGLAAPDKAILKVARAKMGLQHVHWDESKGEVWKSVEGLSLNINAFAPGWVADLLGAELEKNNIKNFMIDIGGEILLKGKKNEKEKWTIGIEKPSQELGHQIMLAVTIEDGSISTSGDYRQYFNDKGIRRSHIIDPRSGRPVEHQISSATVIAATAAEADAWGTAMMVLGEKGLAVAEKNGLKVFILRAERPNEFTSLLSSGMKQYLQQNQL